MHRVYSVAMVRSSDVTADSVMLMADAAAAGAGGASLGL